MLFTSASAEAGVAFMSAKAAQAAPMSLRRRKPRRPRRTDLAMPELFEIKKAFELNFYFHNIP